MVHGFRSRKKLNRYNTMNMVWLCNRAGFIGFGIKRTGINHWRQYMIHTSWSINVSASYTTTPLAENWIFSPPKFSLILWTWLLHSHPAKRLLSAPHTKHSEISPNQGKERNTVKNRKLFQSRRIVGRLQCLKVCIFSYFFGMNIQQPSQSGYRRSQRTRVGKTLLYLSAA